MRLGHWAEMLRGHWGLPRAGGALGVSGALGDFGVLGSAGALGGAWELGGHWGCPRMVTLEVSGVPGDGDGPGRIGGVGVLGGARGWRGRG